MNQLAAPPAEVNIDSEDDDLQAWLDVLSAEFAKEAADRKAMARLNRPLTWEQQMFNFRVEQFRRAIGA